MQCLTTEISTELREHLETGAPLCENVFRYGSDAWAALIREARALYDAGLLDDLDEVDYETLESRTGELATYHGQQVLLEVPELNWDKDNTYLVFVENEEGQVVQAEVNLVTGSSIVTP